MLFDTATVGQMTAYIERMDVDHIILSKADLYTLINRMLLLNDRFSNPTTKERFDKIIVFYHSHYMKGRV